MVRTRSVCRILTGLVRRNRQGLPLAPRWHVEYGSAFRRSRTLQRRLRPPDPVAPRDNAEWCRGIQ